MQNFSHLVQREHFHIRGWMDGGRKMCVFQRKTGHIRNGERYGQGCYKSLIGSGKGSFR